MKVIIMGCGRVGSALATALAAAGHQITVMDVDAWSFRRLPATFGGRAMLGNGMDEDALRRAGVEGADAFVALTQGDNRNIMACQIAKHVFQVPRVVCRIYDPIREELFQKLGLKTISPTKVGAKLVKDLLLRTAEA